MPPLYGARGGCHLQGGYSAPIAFCAGYGEFSGLKSEGAALVARNFAYQNTAYDVLGVCAFAGFSVTLDEYANMLNDVTGLDMKASDLETVSRRVLTLERLFNLLCGFTPEQEFFISWGQWRGDETRPETQRTMVQGDPHPVAKFRVIGPLSNLPEFQQAFACKPGAPMVRQNACRVW